MVGWSSLTSCSATWTKPLVTTATSPGLWYGDHSSPCSKFTESADLYFQQRCLLYDFIDCEWHQWGAKLKGQCVFYRAWPPGEVLLMTFWTPCWLEATCPLRRRPRCGRPAPQTAPWRRIPPQTVLTSPPTASFQHVRLMLSLNLGRMSHQITFPLI